MDDPRETRSDGPDLPLVALGLVAEVGGFGLRAARAALRPAVAVARSAARPVLVGPGPVRDTLASLERRGARTRQESMAIGRSAVGRTLDPVVLAVLDAVDLEAVVGAVSRTLPAESLRPLVEGVLGVIEPRAATPLVEGVVRSVAAEPFGPLVDQVVRQVDPAAPAQLVEGTVAAMDLDALVASVLGRLDLDAAASVGLDHLDLQRVTLAVVNRLDLEPVVDAGLATLDVPGLVDRLELSDLVLAEKGGVAGEAVGFVRGQGVSGDELVSRIVNRILRRRGARAELEPVVHRPLGLPAGQEPPARGGDGDR